MSYKWRYAVSWLPADFRESKLTTRVFTCETNNRKLAAGAGLDVAYVWHVWTDRKTGQTTVSHNAHGVAGWEYCHIENGLLQDYEY